MEILILIGYFATGWCIGYTASSAIDRIKDGEKYGAFLIVMFVFAVIGIFFK